MEIRVASRTDRGRVREQNEDAILTELPLVAVADGMGGHEAGEVASKLALEVLSTWKEKLVESDTKDAAEKLREAFAEVNRAVFRKGTEEEALLGMGTTLTAAWIGENEAALAHVGDSRAYVLRAGQLQQLTEDQTVAQEWVRRGRLSEEEAATSPQRHILLQAIGADTDRLEIEVSTVSLRQGDRLVLMSDGLYGAVKNDERLRDLLVEHQDPELACAALVDAANEAGGDDNISVVIVDVIGEAQAGDAEGEQASEPVLVERVVPPSAPPAATPQETQAPQRSASRVSRKALVVAGASMLLLVMGVLLMVWPRGPNYVVASYGGSVVLLDGKAGGPGRPASGEVLRVFHGSRTRDFPSTVQRQLREGIVVSSPQEAEQVVERLPRRLGPEDTPTPAPPEEPPSPPAPPEVTVSQ